MKIIVEYVEKIWYDDREKKNSFKKCYLTFRESSEITKRSEEKGNGIFTKAKRGKSSEGGICPLL